MKRRRFIGGLATVVAFPGLTLANFAVIADATDTGIRAMQARWRELLAEGADIATTIDPIERSASQWSDLLPRDAYQVLFEDDTERPFSSQLNHEKRAGVFACRACGLPLFTSEMKYDSGTGWPSFFTNIPGHVDTKIDLKLIWPRTEYHCKKCGGHQGHRFDDGPAPTGDRWCNNGLALRFIPLTQA